MTVSSSPIEETAEELRHKVALLEQGMKQATHIREMWTKSARELKAAKTALRQSVDQLTAAHEELEQKNASLVELNERLQEEMELRERMEAELRLSQKLESIGQLAAGVAHEINTPIQYIGDNTLFLRSAFESYLAMFERLRPLGDDEADLEATRAGIVELMGAEDLSGLAEDVPDAIAETLEGIEQVADIVRSMKEFSHRGSQEKAPVNVNRALETTVTVARGEWKRVAEIEWQLTDDLPEIHAVGAELNQVFLNVLVNAAQAVSEAIDDGGLSSGLITISTAESRDGVTVKIVDNGAGIPDSIKEQIFDPFFTTKDVGVGSGQGLSIARSIVVDHHEGTIEVTSEPGVGTAFEIWLPAGT